MGREKRSCLIDSQLQAGQQNNGPVHAITLVTCLPLARQELFSFGHVVMLTAVFNADKYILLRSVLQFMLQDISWQRLNLFFLEEGIRCEERLGSVAASDCLSLCLIVLLQNLSKYPKPTKRHRNRTGRFAWGLSFNTLFTDYWIDTLRLLLLMLK